MRRLVQIIVSLIAAVWVIIPTAANAYTFSRDPSTETVTEPVDLIFDNDSECGGYGGHANSGWLRLGLSGGLNFYWWQYVDDDEHIWTVNCGDAVCTNISADSCTNWGTVDCTVSFINRANRCADGGGGGTTSDVWELLSDSSPPPPPSPSSSEYLILSVVTTTSYVNDLMDNIIENFSTSHIILYSLPTMSLIMAVILWFVRRYVSAANDRAMLRSYKQRYESEY